MFPKDNPDEQTSRTFTLLAKCLQTLANMAEFTAKEPYMIEMNATILNQRECIKRYINDVAVTKLVNITGMTLYVQFLFWL
jgi:hypothetical protein